MQQPSRRLGKTDFSSILSGFRRCIAAASDQLLADRERWFLWSPVAFASGIGFHLSLDGSPAPQAALSLLSILILIRLSIHRRLLAGQILLGLILGAVGFTVSDLHARFSGSEPLIRSLRVIDATAEVISTDQSGRTLKLLVRDVRNAVGKEITAGRVQLYLSARLAGELSDAAVIRFSGRLSPPEPPEFPGMPDRQRKAWFSGISASGFAWDVSVTEYRPVTRAISTLRGRIASALREQITAPDLAEIAVALSVGDRRGIPSDRLDTLRDSGLAHLLAISGLHIGLVTGMAYFASRLLMASIPAIALAWPIKKIAAGIALPVGFFYMLLAGATVPTQRAFIMTGIILAAILCDRRAISLRLVAVAAFIVLCLNPLALTQAGFQMSFAAVTLIVAAYEEFGERALSGFRNRADGDGGAVSGMWRWVVLLLATTAATTLAANIATAPVSAHHFGRIAIAGLAANLLAVPVAAYLVMPALLLFVLLLPLGLSPLAVPFLENGLALVVSIAEYFAGLPHAVIEGLHFGITSLSLTAIGMLWLIIWRRPVRYAGLALILLAFLIEARDSRPVLIIDGKGDWLAYRAGDEIAVEGPGRPGRFTRGIIRQVLSAGPVAEDARCDPVGCSLRLGDKTVSYATSGLAHADDCLMADIVISREPVRFRCPSAALVIDRFDLWRDGGRLLSITTEGEITVQSVREKQGCRLWSRFPGCKREDQ